MALAVGSGEPEDEGVYHIGQTAVCYHSVPMRDLKPVNRGGGSDTTLFDPFVPSLRKLLATYHTSEVDGFQTPTESAAPPTHGVSSEVRRLMEQVESLNAALQAANRVTPTRPAASRPKVVTRPA